MKILANTYNIYADNWLILQINIYKEINTFTYTSCDSEDWSNDAEN